MEETPALLPSNLCLDFAFQIKWGCTIGRSASLLLDFTPWSQKSMEYPIFQRQESIKEVLEL